MKTIIFCLLCMFGAIIAFHDSSLFMSSTMWIAVAVIGLFILIMFASVVALPQCRLTNSLTCIAVFILGIGFVMTLATLLVSSTVLVGIACAFFATMFSLLAYGLYSLANDSDEHDARESESADTKHLVDESYADDNPGA